MNLENDRDMTISDVEALKIHSYMYDNESYSTDSDSGKSSFDEEYYRHKPGPLPIDRKNVVTIKSLGHNEQNQIQDNPSIKTEKYVGTITRKYQNRKYKASTSQYSAPLKSKVITNTAYKNYGYSTDDSSWKEILEYFKPQSLQLDKNKIVTIKSLDNTQNDFNEKKKIGQSNVSAKIPSITDFSNQTSPRNVSQGIEKPTTPSKPQSNNTNNFSQINYLDQFLTSNISQNIREISCGTGFKPSLNTEANLTQNITCNKRISNNGNVYNFPAKGLETHSRSKIFDQKSEINRQNSATDRNRNHRADPVQASSSTLNYSLLLNPTNLPAVVNNNWAFQQMQNSGQAANQNAYQPMPGDIIVPVEQRSNTNRTATATTLSKPQSNNTNIPSSINSKQFLTGDMCQNTKELSLKNGQNLNQAQKPLILDGNIPQNIIRNIYPINSNVNVAPFDPFKSKRISSDSVNNFQTRGLETPTASQISYQIIETKNVAMNRQNPGTVQDNFARHTIDGNRNRRTDTVESSSSTQNYSLLLNASNLPAVINKNLAHQGSGNNNQAPRLNAFQDDISVQVQERGNTNQTAFPIVQNDAPVEENNSLLDNTSTTIENEILNESSGSTWWSCCSGFTNLICCRNS